MSGDSPQAIKGGRGNPGTKGFPGPSGAGGQGPKGKGSLSLFSKIYYFTIFGKGLLSKITSMTQDCKELQRGTSELLVAGRITSSGTRWRETKI